MSLASDRLDVLAPFMYLQRVGLLVETAVEVVSPHMVSCRKERDGTYHVTLRRGKREWDLSSQDTLMAALDRSMKRVRQWAEE